MARELNAQQRAVIDWLQEVGDQGGIDRYPGGFAAFKADLFGRLDGLSTRVPDQAADAVTLLYSGNAGNVQGNWQLAESIGVDSRGRVVTIGNTDIGSLQNSVRFSEALEEAVGREGASLLAELDTGVRPDGSKVESIWDRASRRLAEGATGDVRTLTSLAEDHKVFASVELPALLKNSNVTRINGVPLEAYQRIYAATPGDVSSKLSEVNKAVQASSRGLMSEMRWADAGDHVRGAERYRVDPGQLFEGTPYTEPPRVAANDATFDMRRGPHPYESPDQVLRMQHGRERLSAEARAFSSAHGAAASAGEGVDQRGHRTRIPGGKLLSGLGVAGTAYGVYEGYGELKTAVDAARSTRDLHVRAVEAGADLAVRSGITGAAGFVGGAVGGAGGSLVAPGPGTAAGAIVVGGAAAFGAERIYEESRVQQWARSAGREWGELSYDHFSLEGRLLHRLEDLKEALGQTTDATERRRLLQELGAVSEDFRTEVDRNNAYFEGRGLIDQQWPGMSERFPELDKDDVVAAFRDRLEAGKAPDVAVQAGFSDAVHAEVQPRALPYVPETDYAAYEDRALQQAWRRFSGEVRQGDAAIAQAESAGPAPSGVPLVGRWISEHHHDHALEQLRDERWRDSGHVHSIEAELTRRGLPLPNRHASALSPISERLVADSRQQVEGLANKAGLPMDQGLHNTSFSVAAAAREAGMTRVNLLAADQGKIRAAQFDGSTLRDTSVDALAAANTPVDSSVQRMAAVDAASYSREVSSESQAAITRAFVPEAAAVSARA